MKMLQIVASYTNFTFCFSFWGPLAWLPFGKILNPTCLHCIILGTPISLFTTYIVQNQISW